MGVAHTYEKIEVCHKFRQHHPGIRKPSTNHHRAEPQVAHLLCHLFCPSFQKTQQKQPAIKSMVRLGAPCSLHCHPPSPRTRNTPYPPSPNHLRQTTMAPTLSHHLGCSFPTFSTRPQQGRKNWAQATTIAHLVPPLRVLLQELLKREQLLGDALDHVQPVHAQHDLWACGSEARCFILCQQHACSMGKLWDEHGREAAAQREGHVWKGV